MLVTSGQLSWTPVIWGSSGYSVSAAGCWGFGLLAAVLVITALPLDFVGKLMSLRTNFLLGALHAIEGSGISFSLLQRLRTAFVSAVWSKKMSLARVGAVLFLLDGPPGCDLGFYVVWFRFGLFRRYLVCRPLAVPRLKTLLGLVACGCLGHGPVHLLVESVGVLLVLLGML